MSDAQFNVEWRRDLKLGHDYLERGDIVNLTRIIKLDRERHVSQRATSSTENDRTKLWRRTQQWICSNEICITDDAMIEFASVLRFHPKLSFVNLSKLLVLNTGDPLLTKRLDMGFEFLNNTYGSFREQKIIILLMKMIKGYKGRMNSQEKNHFLELLKLDTALSIDLSGSVDVFKWTIEARFVHNLIDEFQLANVVLNLFGCRDSFVIFQMIMALPQNEYDSLSRSFLKKVSVCPNPLRISCTSSEDETENEDVELWRERSRASLTQFSKVEWCHIVRALAPKMLPVQIMMEIADWCVLLFTATLAAIPEARTSWLDCETEFTLIQRNVAAQGYRDSYAKLSEPDICIDLANCHTQKKRRIDRPNKD